MSLLYTWLQNRTGVFEHVFDGGADGIGVDQNHVVKQLLTQPEGLLADNFDRHTVSKEADLRQLYPPPLVQRLRHGVGINGLDPNDFGLGA